MYCTAHIVAMFYFDKSRAEIRYGTTTEELSTTSILPTDRSTRSKYSFDSLPSLPVITKCCDCINFTYELPEKAATEPTVAIRTAAENCILFYFIFCLSLLSKTNCEWNGTERESTYCIVRYCMYKM